MRSLKRVLKALFNRKGFRDLTFDELIELFDKKGQKKAVRRAAFNRMLKLAKTPGQTLVVLEKSKSLVTNQKEKAFKKVMEFKKFKEWEAIYRLTKDEEIKKMALDKMDELTTTVEKRITVLEIKKERKIKQMIKQMP
mgnify:FL=1